MCRSVGRRRWGDGSGRRFPAVLLLLLVGAVGAGRMQDTVLDMTQVVWSAEQSGSFVGSPSVVRLNATTLLASHDRFGAGRTNETHVHISHDDGSSWAALATISGSYWAQLFVRAEFSLPVVYLMGTSHSAVGAQVVISSSVDGGATWATAVLLEPPEEGSGFATGSCPVLHAQGRFWRAVELWRSPRVWPQFESMLMWAHERAHLMDPASWTATAPLAFDPAWTPQWVTPLKWELGFLEGNPVVDPRTGHVVVVLRAQVFPAVNKAVLLRVINDTTLEFGETLSLPGGQSKFALVWDAPSGAFVSLTNINAVLPLSPHAGVDCMGLLEDCVDQRNELSVVASRDLRRWVVAAPQVLYDDTGFDVQRSLEFTGFQYADVLIDPHSDHLLALVRTAYRGANNYHNANRQTLVRVRDFRPAVRAALDAAEARGNEGDTEGGHEGDEAAWWRALGHTPSRDLLELHVGPLLSSSSSTPIANLRVQREAEAAGRRVEQEAAQTPLDRAERCFWHGDNRCCGGRCVSRGDEAMR